MVIVFINKSFVNYCNITLRNCLKACCTFWIPQVVRLQVIPDLLIQNLQQCFLFAKIKAAWNSHILINHVTCSYKFWIVSR